MQIHAQVHAKHLCLLKSLCRLILLAGYCTKIRLQDIVLGLFRDGIGNL